MVELLVAMAESDCERLRTGWLAQPANAVSSLAYVAVGLWLLWRSRAVATGRGTLVVGGLGMIGAGMGSLAYHGPQPGWAHIVHDGAVVGLAVILAGRTIALLIPRATRSVALAAWRAAAVWIVPGLAIYTAGRSGSPLCHPAALWQPHAAWHILSAVGFGVALQQGSRRRGVGRRPRAPAAAQY